MAATMTDLERTYLLGEGADPGSMTDMRNEVFGTDPDISITDTYVAASTLTPVASYSRTDHKKSGLVALIAAQ